MEKLHTLVALAENKPAVLNRVMSLLRRRGFNIESLTAGHTEVPDISRITIVVGGDDAVVEQVSKQLYKVLEIIRVSDVTADETVDRELALIKVSCTASNRGEIMQLAEIFRAKIVDVAPDSMMIEVTGTTEKVDSLAGLVRSYGIKEMVRTGLVSMLRGVRGTTRVSDSDESK